MKLIEKQKAIVLRKRGYSLKEISQKLNISKGTASVWLRDIKLSEKAIARLSTVVTAGQMKSASNKKEQTARLLGNYYNEVYDFLKTVEIGSDFRKISCSLIYWCEGGKSDNRMVQFTNSDPKLIAGFLSLLRKSYCLDEKKFRACIHLHEYHEPKMQLDFWSDITGIPTSQFIKPYLKSNTGKRIRDNYQGCLQIRYYDANIARQVIMLGKAFFDNFRSLI